MGPVIPYNLAILLLGHHTVEMHLNGKGIHINFQTISLFSNMKLYQFKS